MTKRAPRGVWSKTKQRYLPCADDGAEADAHNANDNVIDKAASKTEDEPVATQVCACKCAGS
jgi:hypothetical protein